MRAAEPLDSGIPADGDVDEGHGADKVVDTASLPSCPIAANGNIGKCQRAPIIQNSTTTPPTVAFPFRIVKLEMATMVPPISNTRPFPPPSTMVTPGPAPTIVRFSKTGLRQPASVIVPTGTTMVSPEAAALISECGAAQAPRCRPGRSRPGSRQRQGGWQLAQRRAALREIH